MDGGFEHKTHYSIGNNDGGIGDKPVRLLGYSCEPKCFAGDASVARTAGRTWRHGERNDTVGGPAFSVEIVMPTIFADVRAASLYKQ